MGGRSHASQAEVETLVMWRAPGAVQILSTLLQHPNSVPLAAWLTFLLTLLTMLERR